MMPRDVVNAPQEEAERTLWPRIITTADGVYEQKGGKVRPIQPFRVPKTEKEIVDLYCTPVPYYKAVVFLEEGTAGLFSFDELNSPEHLLEGLAKYFSLTGQVEISLAFKQLYRGVEEAREEFNQAKDNASGNRNVTERHPEEYERREANAWQRFNATKESLRRRYCRAITSGKLERVKRKKPRSCPNCHQTVLQPGKRVCDSCRQEKRRERNRRYTANRKNQLKTGSPLGIREVKIAFPLSPHSEPLVAAEAYHANRN